MWSGASVALRAAAESIAARLSGESLLPALTVVVYVALLSLLNEIGSLPLGLLQRIPARAALRPVERVARPAGRGTR